MDFQILELFSGIGGMHFAFKYSKLNGHVVAAFDINPVANTVYTHNHLDTICKNNNIQSLTPKNIKKLGVNTILMSPPCQPHTRVGNKLDVEDSRSDGLQHICKILPQCDNIQYILMENVKGFENSEARQRFIASLVTSGFFYCEFILSPTEFGVPNTRHRYYCIARKNLQFPFSTNVLLEQLPSDSQTFNKIALKHILENDISTATYIKDEDLLKRVLLMDIVTEDDLNTMCFTKAYTHYAEGTGSVFTSLKRSQVNEIFENFSTLTKRSERLCQLKKLSLRYFSPREVARLMSFPETFTFPNNVTDRQKYRLLGNSINVMVVGELIKLLCS